jgi:hypothetical protein
MARRRACECATQSVSRQTQVGLDSCLTVGHWEDRTSPARLDDFSPHLLALLATPFHYKRASPC